jgi:hypothetical protein
MTTVIVIAIAICLYRLTIQPHLNLADTYKNLAHIFVGGLFGAGIVYGTQGSWNNLVLWIAVAMTLFEGVCGVLGSKTGKSVVDLIRGR